MRIIRAAFIAIAFLSIASCAAVDKAAVENVEKSHAIILPKFVEYVEKDRKAGGITDEQAEDWKKLVESLRRLTQALKDSGK